MLVISFNLCRAIKMALDQNRAGVSAQSKRCGKKYRPPWNRFPPAALRKEQSAPAAAWCRRSCPPWPATRPSASGIRGGKPHRATPMHPWEIRDAASPGSRGCPPALQGCASIPDLWSRRFFAGSSSRSSLPFLAGQTSSRRGCYSFLLPSSYASYRHMERSGALSLASAERAKRPFLHLNHYR